jgi:hypothetical protein
MLTTEPLPPYFPIVWAFDVTAHQTSDERIVVTGKVPVLGSEFQLERDAYRRYLSSVKSKFGQKGTGLTSPHIKFANAVTDDKLLDFVREFGPVAATEITEVDPPGYEEVPLSALPARRTLVSATETLVSLRRERRIFAAALGLLGELKRGKAHAQPAAIRDYVSEIAKGIWYWPDQWSNENKWRVEHSAGPTAWSFDSDDRDHISRMEFTAEWKRPCARRREDYPDRESYQFEVFKHAIHRLRTSPYDAGQQVLCDLVNSFPAKIECFGDHPAETLPVGAIRFGIRPCLYLILKREFLWGRGTLVCRNDRCNQFFISERAGQVFCGEDCSREYRQRDYWVRVGSKKRRRRRRRE